MKEENIYLQATTMPIQGCSVDKKPTEPWIQAPTIIADVGSGVLVTKISLS